MTAPDDATLIALIEQYHGHLFRLTTLRYTPSASTATNAAAVRHALATLSLGSSVVADLRAEQLLIVGEALRRGGRRTDIARAVGTPDDCHARHLNPTDDIAAEGPL